MKNLFSFVFTSVYVALFSPGCESTSTTCGAPGGTQACVCAGGAAGAQSCGGDGAWGVCECGTLPTDVSVGDTSVADSSVAETSSTDVQVIAGCTDSDARNYSAVATSDDGTCVYAVTFSVNLAKTGLNPESIVYVSGNFQSELSYTDWCETCSPLNDMGDGLWSLTVGLPPGNYQHNFLIDERDFTETIPEACSVAVAAYRNRTFVVADAPVVLPPHRYGECACDATTCTGMNACVGLDCKNPFSGNYTAGRFTIETDRNNCASKFGMLAGDTGAAYFYGVDPTTGEAHFSFRTVQCTAPFRGSSLNMTIDVEQAGGLTVSAPNKVTGPLRLVLKHATYTKTIDVTFSGTISGGRVTGTLGGLPKSVNIGLDVNVTAGTFAAPE